MSITKRRRESVGWNRAASVGLAALLVSLGPGCTRALAPGSTADAGDGVAAPTGNGVPTSALGVERAARTAAYRVKPDARFVRAFAITEAIVTGGATRDATTSFAGGRWNVQLGTDVVATLPVLPSYADATKALLDFGGKLAAAHPIAASPSPASPFDLTTPEVSFDTLEKLQSQWTAAAASTGRNTAAIEDAARAMVSVVEQTRDGLGVADALVARALALVILDKGVAHGDSTRLEALLAYQLGYDVDARAVATNLPPDDAVRAYVFSDDAKLAAIAQTQSDALTQTLQMRRLQQASDHARAAAYRHAHFAGSAASLPVLSVRLDNSPLGENRALTNALPALTLLAVAARAGDANAAHAMAAVTPFVDSGQPEMAAHVALAALGTADDAVLTTYDGELAKIGALAPSPLFDAEAERTYYQAAMGTALSESALFNLDVYASIDAAKRLLAKVQRGGGAMGDDYRKWLGALIASQERKEHASGKLWASVGALPALGTPPIYRLAKEIQWSADWGDTRELGVAKQIFARSDSRVYDRGVLLGIAFSGLNDLRLTEQLGRSIRAASDHAGGAWLLGFLGDDAGLTNLLHDPTVPAWSAVTAIDSLVWWKKLDDAGARGEYARLVALDPASWNVSDSYATYLEKRKAYAEERRVASEWLTHNPHAPGLAPVLATVTVARSYDLEGNHAAAWTAIEPEIPSMQARALGRAAFSLAGLGRYDEAIAIAKKRYDRYRDLSSVAVLAEVYWRAGRNADAAALVVHPPLDSNLLTWRRQVGDAFANVFGSRPIADGVAAFNAMKGADVYVLREIATAANMRGYHALAFTLEEPLSGPGMENLEFLMRSAGFLEADKGHAQMVAWLKPRVPAQLLEPLSQFAFGEHEDALLWEIIPTPAPTRTDEAASWVWLFRTAADLRDRGSPHHAEIEAYYAKAASGEAQIIARYLLGKVDENAIMALATTEKSTCEIAYWLGYKAERDKRYGDASDWYQVAVESALPQVWEFRQSYNTLSRWKSRGRALSTYAPEASTESEADDANQ